MKSNSQTKVESEVKEKQVCDCHPLWKTREGCREVEVSSFWSWESLLLTVKKFPVSVFSFKEIKATRYDHTTRYKKTHASWFVREENRNERLESLICKQSRISCKGISSCHVVSFPVRSGFSFGTGNCHGTTNIGKWQLTISLFFSFRLKGI